MKRGRQMARDASVGIIVTLAAVIFAAGIFSVGSESRLWTRKVSYKIKLPNSSGLGEGSPVTLAGVQVGVVRSLELPADPNKADIDVELSIDDAVQSRIRTDTTATVKILTMLAGDKFVELTTGSPGQPLLPPGSYIQVPQALSLDQMQTLGANIAEDLKKVTASLSTLLDQLQDRSTVIGQALFDPNFGRTTLANVRESIASTRSVIEKIDEGRGLAGRLVSDEAFAADMLSGMQGVVARMDTLLERLGDPEGPLMKALSPEGPLADIVDNLDDSSASLARISEGMGEGKGVAGRLLGDDEYAEEILENLRQATRDLRDVMGKINSGEGTAGAFVNDPEMYEDLRDVLRGVKESSIMSWMIRHYREKGEEARTKEMEERRRLMNESEEGDA